jgi:hypothetical protein
VAFTGCANSTCSYPRPSFSPPSSGQVSGTGLFFANFFARFTIFSGVGFSLAVFFDLVDVVLVFFLVAIRAV